MKKVIRIVCMGFLTAGCAQALTIAFDGGFAGNNNFSEQENWANDTLPAATDNIQFYNGTSSDNPAVVDGAFQTVQAYLYGFGGTAYIEITSGGTLTAGNVFVGNYSGNGQNDYMGQLTVRSGGSLVRLNNNNLLSVGGDIAGEAGHLIVKAGAALLQHNKIDVQEYGTLTFEFGAGSVTAFNSVRSTTSAENNLFDGMLELDLSALTTIGSYTLVTSSDADVTIGGALKTWLDGAGGTRGGSGSATYANFAVLNADGVEWSLSTDNNDQNLVFNVTAIPEPATLGLFAVASIGVLVTRRVINR